MCGSQAKKKTYFCASKVLTPAQRNWSTVERELFAASWGCKKLRSYIYGLRFLLMTDHKPLLGLLNKQGEMPNSRIQTMLLALGEYDFDVRHIPGVRNIIADYGTRFIDFSEWDKPDDSDAEGLNDLLSLCQTPSYVEISNLDMRDHWTLEKLRLKYWLDESNSVMMVDVKGKPQVWLPISSRRAMFWNLHTPLHSGSKILLQNLRDQGIYWNNAAIDLEELLSQCICAVKKDSVPRKYSEKKHIEAEHTLHILAVDLYTYEDIDYFTAICIFSRYAWAKKADNKEATHILSIYEEFCQTHQEPLLLSCNSGPEFSLLPTKRFDNASYHPQSNRVLERFH